jgi:four helix bundle protein
MAAVKRFTDLKCWQSAREWSKRIFGFTRHEPFCSDRRLVEQINDSSESVMSNIAEGFGRGTQGEFVTFLGYAIGSLDETQSHLCAAYDRGYLTKEQFAELFQAGTETRKMTTAFISSMVKRGSGAKHLRKQPSWSEQVAEIYERVTGEKPPSFGKRESQDGCQEDGSQEG